MNKKFITTLGLLLLLNLLIKPYWFFGIDREVQNLLGNSSYGNYYILLNISLILNILLDLGSTNYNSRLISQHPEKLGNTFSSFFTLRLFLSLFYIVACFVVLLLSPHTKSDYRLFSFLIINQFLLSFILYLRSNIAGMQRYKLDSLISVTDKALLITICTVLLHVKSLKQNFTIEWFVYAQTASYLITFAISFGIVFRLSAFFKPIFDFKTYLSIFKKVYPYALLVLLMSIYTRIDNFLLKILLPDGEEQAGIYAHSYRIFEFLNNYGLLFATLLLPMFARMIREKQPVGSLVKLSSLSLIVPSLVVIITAWFYKNEVINMLYDHTNNQSEHIFGLMMAAFLFYALNYIFGALLTANGNLKELNFMAFLSVILNLVLNLILIPKMQAYGAAISCLVTQSFAGIVQIFLATRILHLKINYLVFFQLFLFVICMTGLGWLSLKINIDWKIKGIALLLAGVASAFILRIFLFKEMLELIKSKSN